MRSWTWLFAGVALLSIPQFSLAENGQKNATTNAVDESPVDDRIVATLDYTKSSHMGQPCGGDATQNSQKIEIYATGRVVHLMSDIAYRCNSQGEINRSEAKPVRATAQIATENLPTVLDALRQVEQEAREGILEQAAKSPSASHMDIKLAPDADGVSSLVGLKSSVETDDAAETVWKRIYEAVQKYELK